MPLLPPGGSSGGLSPLLSHRTRGREVGSRHYNVNESLVKPSPKTLMSCFKSNTSRGLKLTSTGPGPGYYNPNDQTKIPKKTLFP
ncbi:hypothetical protein MC885_009394 [Smutsia gigantea]|nr:hypothetical protein MC885_009394 [Smutsia gigantea]